MWRVLNNSNTANDAMTTVKRFIDRLGTQKSRSCQIRRNTLKDIERSTKPVETAKIHRVWVAYCMWNSHLFILFINPKATIQKRGKTNQYFLRREIGRGRFMLLYYLHSGCFPGTFTKDNFYSHWLLTFVSLQTFQTHTTRATNPITNTGDWMLKWCSTQQGILSSYTVDSS